MDNESGQTRLNEAVDLILFLEDLEDIKRHHSHERRHLKHQLQHKLGKSGSGNGIDRQRKKRRTNDGLCTRCEGLKLDKIFSQEKRITSESGRRVAELGFPSEWDTTLPTLFYF